MFSRDKIRIRHALRHALIGGALLIVSAAVALAAPAGTVVGLSGGCVVESAGARSQAKMGQPVQVGDTLDVPADGKLKLRMADGSVVSVASGTRMTIAAYVVDGAGQRQEARLSLPQGLLRAVVAPVERPASFEVTTAVGTAAARSTDWFVEAFPNAMQVGVLSGSVEMTSTATSRGVMIPARWGARLEGPDSPPSAPMPGGVRGAFNNAPRQAAGRDPVPPRVWGQAEFAGVIARTDL